MHLIRSCYTSQAFPFRCPRLAPGLHFLHKFFPFQFFLSSPWKQWKAISNLFVIRLSVIEEILDSYEEYMYIHIHVRGLLDCLVSTYKESPLFPPPFLFKVHSGGTLHIVCTRATDIYTVLHKVVVRLCILRQLIGIPKGDGKVDSICLAFYNWIWGRVRSSTILITHESDFIMPNEFWWEWKISERERRSLDYFLHQIKNNCYSVPSFNFRFPEILYFLFLLTVFFKGQSCTE